MDFRGPEFVLAIIGLSMAAWIVTTWIRARHGYPLEGEWGGTVSKGDAQADRKIELLSSENEALTSKIDHLQERIAVLERIATDKPRRLSDEIDALL